jgi:hypothetical protein
VDSRLVTVKRCTTLRGVTKARPRARARLPLLLFFPPVGKDYMMDVLATQSAIATHGQSKEGQRQTRKVLNDRRADAFWVVAHRSPPADTSTAARSALIVTLGAPMDMRLNKSKTWSRCFSSRPTSSVSTRRTRGVVPLLMAWLHV